MIRVRARIWYQDYGCVINEVLLLIYQLACPLMDFNNSKATSQYNVDCFEPSSLELFIFNFLNFFVNDLSMSFKQTGGQGRLSNNLERYISTSHWGLIESHFFASTIHGKMMTIQSYKFVNSTIHGSNFFQWGCLALCNATYSNT